jgi:tetratricopeptide (TPR) repeat protein
VLRPRFHLLAAAAILVAALAAYHGTFSAPFVFDAAPIATRYPSIRHLWPIADAFRPPHDGSTVDGRPMANFALAVCYALSGTRVWAYHAVDLAIHLLAAWTLFGIVRRTLARLAPPARGRRGDPDFVAFAAALLWTVHPLQTEAITYVIQCAESLMGLFYLLTLYGFVRAVDAPAGPTARRWFGAAWLACLAGMATKEVMVTAPVMVLLYDRTFVAGGFREAWRRRGKFHLALAGTWILLGWLVAGSGNRAGSAGLGVNVAWSDYALTQVYGVVHYVRLAFWPRPLVFDYGTALVTAAARILPRAILLAAGLAATGWALRRRPAAGFLGAWFFVILAPTSLVPVATEPLAEHRLYLPLAAAMVGVALALFAACAALWGERGAANRAGLVASLAVASVYAAVTIHRNALYGAETALWADTAAKVPGNARAHLHLGRALYEANRIPEAEQQFRLALGLQPYGNYDAQFDLGDALLREGRVPEAAAHLAEAVALKPDSPEAQSSWGDALFATGRVGEAAERYAQAARLAPDNPLPRYNLGNALARLGRMPEAIAQYEAALRLNPAFAQAEDNLGNALYQERRLAEAIPHYESAVRLAPASAGARLNLAAALARAGRFTEAREQYEAALRLRPGAVEIRDIINRLPAADRQ